jgi:hypothetical protein
VKQRELLCLRCDWAGATKGGACPNCGVGLFRPAPPPRQRHRPGGPRRDRGEVSAPRLEAAPAAAFGAGDDASIADRSRVQSVVGFAVVVVLAIGAFVFVRATTPVLPRATSEGSPIGTLGLGGVLLYTAADPGPAGSRLWIWDLVAGSVRQGPIVANPRELVALSTGGRGWIGVTSGVPGGQEASVLRSLDVGAHAAPVLRGQRIAWSPGDVVNSASVHSPAGPCGRLVVRAYVVAAQTRQRQYEGRACGQLAAFTRSTALPFVALAANGGMTIAMVGGDSMLPVLRDHLLMGASTAGDFLVEPVSCLGPAPGPTASHCSGIQLFFRSPDRPPPLTIGVPGEGLLAERVLGWTGDATAAYVLGILGGRRGVYKVPVAPIERPLRPELLFAVTNDEAELVETFDGRVIIAQGGSFVVSDDGVVAPLSRPPGAPAPDGPMVWLPTLPYSPA